MLALAAALAVRLPRVLAADFPINDGGIFNVMARELAAAHLALPAYTTYNDSRIPFAYPPLGLYVAAALNLATGASVVSLQRLLPLLANLATVAVFAALARALLAPARVAGLAAVLFAVLPRSYEWLIMGGGLTRSFGFLFLCLTVLSAHRALPGRRRSSVVPAGAWLACAVLSHPEMGLLAVAWVALLTVTEGMDRRKLAAAAAIAAIGGALAAPWLLTTVARHGVSPFLAAGASSGFWLTGSLARLLSPALTGEAGLPVVAVLALLGAAISLARRQLLVPGWLLAALVLTPRAALTPATVAIAMLAALALGEAVLPGVAAALGARPAARARDPEPGEARTRPRVVTAVGAALALLVVGYTAVASNLALPPEIRDAMRTVPRTEREAMTWVAEHTPPESTFVVASGAATWTADPVDAWFPALAQRASAVTPNGAEWLPRREFRRREGAHGWLERCPTVDVPCLDGLVAGFGVAFTHVYVSKGGAGGRRSDALGESAGFALVYDGPGAAVYARRDAAPAPPRGGAHGG